MKKNIIFVNSINNIHDRICSFYVQNNLIRNNLSFDSDNIISELIHDDLEIELYDDSNIDITNELMK